MKIEKISDNQVKFVLNQADLEERNIRLTELAYGTEKTQALFREMMEQATIECGFDADNVPLMIEAIPFASDGITIIVTKVGNVKDMDDIADIEERFGVWPHARQKRNAAPEDRRNDRQKPQSKKKTTQQETISIFSFDNLDQVTNVSVRLYGQFNGTNVLFKNQNKYFLLLQNDAPGDTLSIDDLDAVLGEYGQKHVSTVISKHYLAEHGEVIIKDPAIKVMAEHLC